MLRRSLLPWLLLLLLLLAGCWARRGFENTTAAPVPSETGPAETEPVETEPAETEPDEPESPFAPGVLCEEPALESEGVFVSLYRSDSENNAGALWQWSCRFNDVRSIAYDPYSPPVRFEGDKSLWMTYQRDGDFDNCIVGRCISTQAEWELFTRVLFSVEYEADPEFSVPWGSPEFILRQGTDCTERTSRIGSDKTGYLDDEVCRYCVTADGDVLRCDADGSILRAITPLGPETVARLFLIYEAYYRAYTIQCPCIYHLDEPGGEEPMLLVRTADRELYVPKEKWTDFLALVSVEEDKEVPSDLPCFQVITQLYSLEDYPSPEVLRFTFYTDDYDPDSGSWWRWFSLRQDGRIIVETRSGVGLQYNIAYWSVICPVRFISKASFDVGAITALLFSD